MSHHDRTQVRSARSCRAGVWLESGWDSAFISGSNSANLGVLPRKFLQAMAPGSPLRRSRH